MLIFEKIWKETKKFKKTRNKKLEIPYYRNRKSPDRAFC